MLRKARVKAALLRQKVDKFPMFMSATPQFSASALKENGLDSDPLGSWKYCVNLGMDVIQIGHSSFYPVRVMDLAQGEKYIDEWGRSHVISGLYDNFCAPFPLQNTSKINIAQIKEKWQHFSFPDPTDQKYFVFLDAVHEANESLDDPLSIWGVINGSFEPSWQLLSDGWPELFILARRDRDLANDILSKVTDYCIRAGNAMIEHGVDCIRIGDDYALNEGLMCAPKLWKELIFPNHSRLVHGLKAKSGSDFPVILHSDGNIMSILDWLAEGGLDAINPIQPDALDFGTVVNQIGNKLSITGAFDLRYFLEGPTAEHNIKMETEVNRLFNLIRQYNTQGNTAGFCIGPTHQVQPRSIVKTFEKWVEIVHKNRNFL